MNITFRVDANKKTGIGHLMRCIALSEEFNNKDYLCYFISHIEGRNLKEKVIKKNNFLENIKPIKIINNLENDLKFLLKFSKIKNIDWIVTDHYKINSNYLKKIKKSGINLLSIDDYAQTYYYSDIVVNQNIGAEKLKIKGEKYTNFLLGTRYVMLCDDLLRRKEKIVKKDIENLLITLGGTDKNNYTLKILKQIDNINVNKMVLIGALNPNFKKIINYTKNKTDIKVIKSPKSMFELYKKTDIAISAGGTMCYELAYFGIPNIIITIADNQIRTAKLLDKEGVSIYLGDKNSIDLKEIKIKTNNLIDNKLMRKKFSKKGRELINGNGKKLIADFIERYN